MLAGPFADVFLPSLAQGAGAGALGALQGLTQAPFAAEELRRQQDETKMRALDYLLKQYQPYGNQVYRLDPMTGSMAVTGIHSDPKAKSSDAFIARMLSDPKLLQDPTNRYLFETLQKQSPYQIVTPGSMAVPKYPSQEQATTSSVQPAGTTSGQPTATTPAMPSGTIINPKASTKTTDQKNAEAMGLTLKEYFNTFKHKGLPEGEIPGLGIMSWRYLLWGTNPPGFGNLASEVRIKVAETAQGLANGLGLSPMEVALLPQSNKIKMQTVGKMTQWGSFVDSGTERLIKHLDVAIDYAKKIDPTQLVAINKLIIAGERQFNDPTANAYAAQMDLVKREYGRITAGPLSNAMLPVEFVKQGDKFLNPGLNVAALQEMKTVLVRDAKITSESVRNQSDKLMDSIRSLSPGIPQSTYGESTGSGPASLPSGIPPGSKQIGTSKGKPVYQTPDGKKLIVE